MEMKRCEELPLLVLTFFIFRWMHETEAEGVALVTGNIDVRGNTKTNKLTS